MTSFIRQRDSNFSLGRQRYEIREIIDGPNALANFELGKATASVSFSKDECQWGSLEQRKAGILHFHTARLEPRGCKLRDLNVKLTFSGRPPDDPTSNSVPNVYLLDRPAPAFITGGKKTKEEEKSFSIEPNVATPMGNIALGGFEKRTRAEIEDAWTYTSQWMPEGQTYNAAIWQWQAKDAALQLEEVGDLHGGVVVCHDGQPFYICCDMEGKLLSHFKGIWSKRRWYWFKSTQVDSTQLYRVVPDTAAKTDLEQHTKNLEVTVRALFEKSRAITL